MLFSWCKTYLAYWFQESRIISGFILALFYFSKTFYLQIAALCPHANKPEQLSYKTTNHFPNEFCCWMTNLFKWLNWHSCVQNEAIHLSKKNQPQESLKMFIVKMWFRGGFGFFLVIIILNEVLLQRKTGRGRSLSKGETHSNPCKNCCKRDKIGSLSF